MRRVRTGIAYTKDGVPLKYSYHVVFTMRRKNLRYPKWLTIGLRFEEGGP